MAEPKTLAFELGFDWNVYPIPGIRDGVFPLQLSLVDDAGSGTVVSPCDPSTVKVFDRLLFRIYDFTDDRFPPAGPPEPSALQILFSSASTIDSHKSTFSPFEVDGQPLAQLAATSFQTSAPPSIAYGDKAMGWTVEWSLDVEAVLVHPGRFKLRALLTVAIPGEMARFYRADPEMVIGDAGGGP